MKPEIQSINTNIQNCELAISYHFENEVYTDFLFQDEITADLETIDQVFEVLIFSLEKEIKLSGKEARDYLKKLNQQNLKQMNIATLDGVLE